MAIPLRSGDTSQLTQVHNLREQIERAERRRADTATIPVVSPLSTLFLDGGLKPGATYAIHSSVSLLLSLMAAPSTAGLWCAAVGFPTFSPEAAEGMGVALERLVLIPQPGERWLTVAATLAEVIPVIALRPSARPRDAEIARLSARLRERGGVLLVLGEWPGAESELSLSDSLWQGLGDGYGALHSRSVTVSAHGRRMPIPRQTRVLLPDSAGTVSAVASFAAPTHRGHLTAVNS